MGTDRIGFLRGSLFLGAVILLTAAPASAQIGSCHGPDLEVDIREVSLSPDGTQSPVLHFDDPNPASVVTGYNVLRSSGPAQPRSDWPELAVNAADEDAATPGIQWTDGSGENSPTEVWYYLVAPYDESCAVEGPWKTISVNSKEDSADLVPGDGSCMAENGRCTLRAAVQEANALGGKEVVALGAEIYVLGIDGAGEDGATAGDLDLTAPVVLRGMGAKNTAIDAFGLDRVVHVLPGVEVTIADLTLQNGEAVGDGGGLRVENQAHARLETVAVNANHSRSQGGGIAVDPAGMVGLQRTTLSHNVAEGNGGGVAAGGEVTIENSTFGWNSAGGYEPDGSGGATGDGSGGGIFVGADGVASLSHVTLSDNRANLGGAIANLGSVELRNSIVANSHQGGNCDGEVASLEFNLSSDFSCDLTGENDLLGFDPALAVMDTYGGGQVGTFLPQDGSPVIDHVENCLGQDQLLTQRSAICSVGAAEHIPIEFVVAAGLAYVGDHPRDTITPGGDVRILNTGTHQVVGHLTIPDINQMVRHDYSDRVYMLQQVNSATPITQNGLIGYDAQQNTAFGMKFGFVRRVALNAGGTMAFVSDYANDTVDLIHTGTNTIVGSIPVGWFPMGLAISPHGVKGYVANSVDNTVSVFLVSAKYVSNTIAVGTAPRAIAFNPLGSRAYVLNHGDVSLSVIDTLTEQVITTIPLGSMSQTSVHSGDVAVHPDGHVVYVADSHLSHVAVISTSTNQVIDTIPFAALRVKFHPVGTRAYLSKCAAIDEPFAVVDTATHNVVAKPSVDGAAACGLAIRP